MTISYAAEVPNGSSFGCFWKVLCKWKGSVYKLVWRELLAYLALYYIINILYRYALNEHQQRTFAKIQKYFGAQSESIPMSFVLGFYVSLVVKRWWDQFRLLPWPDTLALYISAGIPGDEETGRLMRRNIVRYAVLSYVITLQRVSLRVKRRFPTWQHLVDSGLMMDSERKIFEMMDTKSSMSKYWMPLVWATNIINRARKEGMIASDHLVQTMLLELSDMRRRLGSLIGYDTVCVPLVYTQVVTLALYTYFIAALMGRQMVPVPHDSHSTGAEEPDFYFPLFTALQFGFYVGWLKVAEVLINPFGEDDDDIELNWLIDRHIKAAYMIVDEMHEEHPELLKDQYWEDVVPRDLPYTVASEHYRRHEPPGSADHYKVSNADAMYANLLPPVRKHDDVYADYESVDTPLVERRKNWFARQITRMGSGRSASTAYSSGGPGLFARPRVNSVYSNGPEAPPNAQGGLQQSQQHLSPAAAAAAALGSGQNIHKMSLYDRLVGRQKSQRNKQFARHSSKLNGSGVSVTVKNRPRIPTPDVTKEVVDREQRLLHGALQNHAQGVTLMAHQLSGTTPPNYASQTQFQTANEVSVVGALVLSPIQELEGGSHNSTLLPNSPSTAALAQSILQPALQSAGIPNTTPVTLPVSVAMSPIALPVSIAQLSSLGLVTTTTAPIVVPNTPMTITEITSSDESSSGGKDNNSESAGSLIVSEGGIASGDRSRKTSAVSQKAPKSGEVYV